jgi:hypothetical protein
MVDLSRRTFLSAQAGAAGLLGLAGSVHAQAITQPPLTKRRWLDLALDRAKSIDTPLYVGRFRDPMYFLLEPITWSPNADQVGRLAPVTAPKGFVTDFASIPPVFILGLDLTGNTRSPPPFTIIYIGTRTVQRTRLTRF